MPTVKYILSTAAGDRPTISLKLTMNSATKVQTRVNGVLAFREHWNAAKQTHNTKRVLPPFLPEVLEINKLLSGLSVHILSAVAALPPERIGKAWLADEVDRYLHPERNAEAMLLSSVDNFIETMPTRINPSTGRPMTEINAMQYRQMRRHLAAYLEQQKRNDLPVSGLDKRFYDSFVSYLYGIGLAPNTVGKHIKEIKAVLHSLPMKDQVACEFLQSGKCVRIAEEVDNIYLTEEELTKIADAELPSNSLRVTRDMFLLLAWTGCRYSDLGKLTKANIVTMSDGYQYFKLVQKKTGARVTIPIFPITKAILERYDYELPEPYSNPKFNLWIKTVCQLAGIVDEVTLTRSDPRVDSHGKARVETVTKRCPKYECVTAHTARRSFATNMYKRGFSTLTIMAITGHKTERAFLLYIKVSEDEHAERMMRQFLSQK